MTIRYDESEMALKVIEGILDSKDLEKVVTTDIVKGIYNDLDDTDKNNISVFISSYSKVENIDLEKVNSMAILFVSILEKYTNLLDTFFHFFNRDFYISAFEYGLSEIYGTDNLQGWIDWFIDNEVFA